MKFSPLLRQVFTPAMIAACGILLGTILVRQYLVQGMGLVFAKQTLPLRRELKQIPLRLGDYETVQTETLSATVVKSLGTTAYLSRIYRDTRKNYSPETAAAIWFYAVYYTGTAETLWVRHVPDECFVGAGHQKIDSRLAALKLAVGLEEEAGIKAGPAPAGAPSRQRPAISTLPVNVFQYQSGDTGESAYAVYFFIVNGRNAVSRQELRMQLLDIRKRHSYFCKIELLPGILRYQPGQGEHAVFTGGLPEAELTLQAVTDFLTVAMPELRRCLPEGEASR